MNIKFTRYNIQSRACLFETNLPEDSWWVQPTSHFLPLPFRKRTNYQFQIFFSSNWSNIYSDWLKTDRSQILKPAMNQFLVEIGRPNHDNCQIIYRLYNALLLEWVTEFSEGNGQPITTIRFPIRKVTSVAS